MSVKQTALVWDHSPLRAERLLVHLAIADHMDHDGRGWVSWSMIQAKAHVGRTVVAETIRQLRDLGLMVVLEPAAGTRATVYQLVWPGSPDVPLDDHPEESYPSARRTRPPGAPVRLTASRGPAETSRGPSAGTSSVLTSVLDIRPSSCPHSDECRRAADNLAARIVANGSNPPKITCRWHTDLDRLHRIDGRTWEQIDAAIDYSQTDPFWRAVILSPTKLRAKYEQLRLHAARSHTVSHPPSKVAAVAAEIAAMRDQHPPEPPTEPRRVDGEPRPIAAVDWSRP